ncbi:DUF6452 family protein [Myroides pelagicus]|uniref:DUF6452 family protein n=1 Tax=Myroides pelagicus TaxID=270914 RepID=UPI002DBB0EE0|nr:DUF6452 family protein [Myroides pelagicus]MEC4114806.1 DUF6452 family protein [Myroides pelagicus]
MKKIIYASIALLLGTVTFVSCEKDDICAETEPTTPSFLIEFFDYEDQERPRSETIEAYALGYEQQKITSIGNKLSLPLRLDQQETSWVLTRTVREQEQTIAIKDTLTYAYKINTTYLNKACGYVSTFSLNQDGSSPLLNGKRNNKQGNWIKLYITETNEIINEDQAHFTIYY